MEVLIIGTSKDLHVQAVSRQLQELGITPRYFSFSHLLKNYTVKLELGGGQPVPACQLFCDDSPDESEPKTVADLFAVSAIWLRRPGQVRARDSLQTWADRLVESESRRAIEGLLRIVPALWVNHPTHQDEATFKLRQLEAARQCGLITPRTLVTNKPDAVEDFYNACEGRLIYKLIDEMSSRHLPAFEIPRGIPTLAFKKTDLEHLNQVTRGLHLFQERIEKIADVRATIVGNEIFAVRIESQVGKGNVDFRLDYSVPMSVYQLPDEVATRCIDLMRRLGLNFGAMDLCLTGDGHHIFLEVNPAGQWLWMESALDLPISQTMARLLARQVEPLVHA
jgi:glutathione synthase/RimK-type ligase-like ATP-grasp enzyme